MSKYIKYLVPTLIIVFAGYFFADHIQSDEFAVTEGDHGVGHVAKRDFKLTVSLDYAKKKVGKGYLQSEINFITDDKLEGVVPVSNTQEVSGKQPFSINIDNHSMNKKLYFYVFHANNKNRIKTLFPNKKRGLWNPVYQGSNYSIPYNKKWLKFSKNRGVEKFYFFVSKKKIKTFRKKPTKRILDSKTKRFNKAYLAVINKRKQIKNNKINPVMVWFKRAYATKIVIINKGKRIKTPNYLKRKAKFEMLKSKIKVIK